MKTTILERAKKIIDDRHFDAERQALAHKEQAYNDQKFKNLYLAYVNQMIENAKTGVDDNEKLSSLKQEFQNRLKELNIGSVEPIYNCKKCNDTGMNGSRYCDCLIDEVNKILKYESGFLELEDFESSNFQIFQNKDFIQKLYSKMQAWCHSNFDKTIICLAGQTGVGKTHLIKCMANELIKRHKLVLLTTSFAMHQDFVKSYSTRDANEKQNLISKYIDAEILFIDDLGSELRNPNVTLSYLYQVLNERRMNKRPTIITTNLTLSDINDYYDERISSRIADKNTSICVYIEDKDLRLQKNN